MPLIESRKAKDMWSAGSLSKMGLEKDNDPFELADRQEGSVPCLTGQAVHMADGTLVC